MYEISWKLILVIIHVIHSFIYLFIHSFIHPSIHSFIHSLSYFSMVRSNRARDRCRNLYFWSFHSLSYSSTVKWIELEIDLIELGIVLRISNAGRTVLARVSGLVQSSFIFHFCFGPKVLTEIPEISKILCSYVAKRTIICFRKS